MRFTRKLYEVYTMMDGFSPVALMFKNSHDLMDVIVLTPPSLLAGRPVCGVDCSTQKLQEGRRDPKSPRPFKDGIDCESS